MKRSEIPKWLLLEEEICYWHFMLGQILKREEPRDTLSRMIDQATGYDKAKLKDAKRIIAKITKLEKSLNG